VDENLGGSTEGRLGDPVLTVRSQLLPRAVWLRRQLARDVWSMLSRLADHGFGLGAGLRAVVIGSGGCAGWIGAAA
jgi:hypothetical protein